MAIATGNAVKFVYVSGSSLPATVDDDTVYFVATSQQLYVGSQLIADHIDISDKQDTITVTTSGSGNNISNVAWDKSTATFTITKSNLPTLSKGTATGSGNILTGISVSDHEITEAFTSELATGTTVQTAPTTDMGVANKKYVDDAVESLTGAMHFLGTSSTAITDGGTETPTISGEPVTPAAGDVVLYNGLEFVWDGSVWEQLGDESSYALKTTSVTAGSGLSGGGTLASDVTISHGAIGTASADDITADSTGHLYVMTGVDKDTFGHVASVNEKDIYSDVETIAQDAADAVQLTWTVVS